MQGVAVEFAVDGDRADSELAAGADHSDGDLSSVGDQNFGKHVLLTSPMTPLNATPEPGIFAASEAAAAGAGFSTFQHVCSTGSTNTDLADEARAGDSTPAVLVADHQTAGRGRLDRAWIDDSVGQLMVSMRIPTQWAEPTLIGPAVAVLVRAVVAADGVPALIKWPNDLCVPRRDGSVAKLAGYLGEFVDGSEPVVILGMGINVESTPFDGSASVQSEGGSLGRDDILAAVLGGLRAMLADPMRVRRELLAHSATVGRRVRVELTGGDLVGEAVGLDDAGALQVEAEGRIHTISVGDVVHLRTTSD